MYTTVNSFPLPYDFNIFFSLAYFKNAVYLYLSFGGDKNFGKEKTEVIKNDRKIIEQ